MIFLARLKKDSPTGKTWKDKGLKRAVLWNIDWELFDGTWEGEIKDKHLIEALSNKEIEVAGFGLRLPVEPLAA